MKDFIGLELGWEDPFITVGFCSSQDVNFSLSGEVPDPRPAVFLPGLESFASNLEEGQPADAFWFGGKGVP